MSEEEKGKINFCNHIVCRIDILGQGDKLRELAEVPITGEQSGVFHEKILQTYGVVGKLFKNFKDWFDGYEKFDENDRRYIGLSTELKTLLRNFKSGKLHIIPVSDSIIMYIPIINIGQVHDVRSIAGLMAANAMMMIISFSRGIAIRGGIEIGLAGEFPDIGLYGPVLQDVYVLENKLAQYPRIVIGNKMVDYLKWLAYNNGTERIENVYRQFGKDCLSYLFEDFDGRPTLDFLGTAMLNEYTGLTKIPSSLIQDGFNFVSKECDRFKREQNYKLASRYTMLMNYYLKRMDNWKIDK
jgi:hypothetical protein